MILNGSTFKDYIYLLTIDFFIQCKMYVELQYLELYLNNFLH